MQRLFTHFFNRACHQFSTNAPFPVRPPTAVPGTAQDCHHVAARRHSKDAAKMGKKQNKTWRNRRPRSLFPFCGSLKKTKDVKFDRNCLFNSGNIRVTRTQARTRDSLFANSQIPEDNAREEETKQKKGGVGWGGGQ